MRKNIAFWSAALLLLLSGCSPSYNNSSTRILMDTVVNIEADAEHSVISDAMALCETHEKLFSRTLEGSEVSRLNNGEVFNASEDTRSLIEKAFFYSEKTNGLFDITIGAVSELWDFSEGVMADSEEIQNRLPLIDYKKIEINENKINLNGAKIDLGGCAKGYTTDKIRDFLKTKQVKNAVINLGGNLYIMGEKQDIGIKKPFNEGNIATLRIGNKAVVTAGTYERGFSRDGRYYHHILDTKTGYPVDTDLVSVTVIADDATDADILSTALVCMGLNGGINFIENTEGVEALFITTDGEIHISSGIYCKDGIYRL